MATNRTPTDTATRCVATEGAQQCLKAVHSKLQNHTWGKKGETAQWNDDGTPKAAKVAEAEAAHPVWGESFVPDDAPDRTDQFPAVPDETLVTGNAEVVPGRHGEDITPIAAASPPPEAAGELPATATRPVSFDDTPDEGIRQAKMVPYIEDVARLNRPDASEGVLGVAMSRVGPAADQGFAIRHAEVSAKILVAGQHIGEMFNTVFPPDPRLPAADDVRAVYRKMREIAATLVIDLDGES
jgi:hypothetical protein